MAYFREWRTFRSSALSLPGAESPQMEILLLWNFRSVEHSLLGTFASVERSFLEIEYSKNFRSKSPKNNFKKCDDKPHNCLRVVLLRCGILRFRSVSIGFWSQISVDGSVRFFYSTIPTLTAFPHSTINKHTSNHGIQFFLLSILWSGVQ